ncbi:hypothetical protein [Ruegeria sp. SCP11]|uniref:hypothetical protein n=1 Tax=Ruegeria sp. SCP11 TaxID=3141378 RepID=UPI003335E0E5
MKHLFLAIATIFIAQDAVADFIQYECIIDRRTNYGWITKQYYVAVDPANGLAGVKNYLIGEVPADVKIDKKQRYQLSWEADTDTGYYGELRVYYSARLDPKTLNFKVRGRFSTVSFSDRPKGTGKCHLRN